MSKAYISAKTLDDLMREVIGEVFENGRKIAPSKGDASELTGVLLELLNPRARLSRTESRGKPYSCLGELCWYLAGTNKLDFISYYIPRYKESSDGVEVFGGYGPRLMNWGGQSQIAKITEILKEKRDSRQAVIQLFDRNDIAEEHADVPCTCTLQFMLRAGRLHMFTNMRSNDVFLGLPHDIFCFTMLQEIIAKSLATEIGTYKHAVGSLHLYDEHIEAAKDFMEEGFQPTGVVMPPIPNGDPWLNIELLLRAECAIRTSGTFELSILDNVDPYWADLIWLLQVFSCKQSRNLKGIKDARQKMSSSIYFPFIDKVIIQLG